MYAIVEVDKKQYKVEKGDVIEVERLDASGGKVVLDKVLLTSDKEAVIGCPYVKGAKVTAVILRDVRSPKTIAFKYRRRKGFHRKVGHRQNLTRIKIDKISV